MFRQSTSDKCPPNGWVKQKKNSRDNIPITGMLQKSQNNKKKYFCNLQNTVIHPHLFNSFPQNLEFL